MPLIIFLVECGLELIPPQIKSHPAIKKNIVKNDYASLLLDNAIHHSGMISGRPLFSLFFNLIIP
ncbi:MAG: hypothetical protein P8Y23_08115, partial [Candidatus Lokiarchaeota archaeon]